MATSISVTPARATKAPWCLFAATCRFRNVYSIFLLCWSMLLAILLRPSFNQKLGLADAQDRQDLSPGVESPCCKRDQTSLLSLSLVHCIIHHVPSMEAVVNLRLTVGGGVMVLRRGNVNGGSWSILGKTGLKHYADQKGDETFTSTRWNKVLHPPLPLDRGWARGVYW